jgi:uncharacterized membrane protein
MSELFQYSDQFRAPVWMVLLRLAIILAVMWPLGKLISRRIGSKATSTWQVIFVSILAWLVLFSVGMLRHMSFHSKAWDLAIFDQVVWNLANGHGWECSVRGVQDLRGDHFEPILWAFAPLYRLYPHVGWLLGAQAASLVGCGLMLWATYRRKLGESVAFMLLCGYLFFPPIHWLAMADFHPIALAPLFASIGWWARERGRPGWFAAGLIGMSLCGEEALIVAGWWGFWELFARHARRPIDRQSRFFGWFGAILGIIFWAGFVYLAIVFIPAHRHEAEGYFYVHRYAYLGESIPEIARNFVTRPLVWIGHLIEPRSLALLALYLVPLGLLPLIRMKYLALLIPTIVYTLLSESPEQRSIFHQYTAMWIPFLMIAAAEALSDRDGRARPDRAGVLLVASVAGTLALSPIFGLSMHPELLQPESWAGEAKAIVATIAPDQAVSAPSALCPHLSHRRVILLKPNTEWPGSDKLIVLPDFPP